MKKYTIVFDDNKNRICKILGVYYTINHNYDYYNIEEKINIFTLCFCKKTKEFFTIAKVDLPKRLYNRYQDAILTDSLKNELEQIGIYPYQSIKNLIDNYNEYLDLLELNKYISNHDIPKIKNRYNELLNLQDKLSDTTNIRKLEKK